MSLFSSIKKLSLEGELKKNYPLGNLTWLKSGGSAEIFFKPSSLISLKRVFSNLSKNVNVLILGNGSNILIRDKGVKGVVMKLGNSFSNISLHGDHIEIGAAALNSTIAQFCLQNCIKNFAFLQCIPGCIGGAIFMNSGCYGYEISDFLIECTFLTRAGELVKLKRKEINFSYRKSNMPEDVVILSAKFIKEKGSYNSIYKEMQMYKHSREVSQPTQEKTAGCTFMNTKGKKAWQLIKESGCQDLTFGDAKWSDKHANFLINAGSATSSDLEKLIKVTQEKIYEMSGIMLNFEVRIVGQ